MGLSELTKIFGSTSGSNHKFEKIFELIDPKKLYSDTFQFFREIKDGIKSNLGPKTGLDEKSNCIFEFSNSKYTSILIFFWIYFRLKLQIWWHVLAPSGRREGFLTVE